MLRPSAKKSSTPILDGVENSSSDIQKCGFCLNLSAKQDFPPRYMDAYCGVENRVLLRPSTKKSSTLMMDGVEDSSSDIQKCGFCASPELCIFYPRRRAQCKCLLISMMIVLTLQNDRNFHHGHGRIGPTTSRATTLPTLPPPSTSKPITIASEHCRWLCSNLCRRIDSGLFLPVEHAHSFGN